MKVVKEFEKMHSLTKGGTKKFWQILVVTPDDVDFYIQTKWSHITKTGNLSTEQSSEPYLVVPTNVGRANERGSKEQAIFEAESDIKKQYDKGFRPISEKVEKVLLPMLAHKFKDHKKKVQYPVYIQPKLNGMRMLFDGKNGTSRGNKEILPNVIAHMAFAGIGTMYDGELILPGNLLLQETMKAAKKYRPGVSDQLVYYVYDVVDDMLPFHKRYDMLKKMKFPPNIKLTPTYECNSEEEIYTHFYKFLSDGYEGAIIRSKDGLYEINKRSYHLLKLKEMVDAEFKVVDVVDGGGKDAGLAIFVLETENGLQTFNCRPEGTEDNRRELFNDKRNLIGEYLTVRFQELSKDGVPLFPVGVCIRDQADFKVGV